MSTRDHNLLILDVDETLIRGADPHSDPPDPRPPRVDFITCGRFQVMKRPHVEDFLRWCFSCGLFKVAVWSAASPCHVDGVMQNLLLPHEHTEFRFYGDRCTSVLRFPDEWDEDSSRYLNIKDLRKVLKRGYDRNRVLVLDDQYQIWKRSYGNLVHIRSFMGDPNDDELLRVRPFLEQWFQDPKGVRKIEKRFWRSG